MAGDDLSPHVAKEVIGWGTEMIGSSVGAVIGALSAGPPGAVAGAAAGTFTGRAMRLMADYAHRQLSARERVRIGAAFGFAIERVRARVQAGDTPRADGFFDNVRFGRSPADEILEGAVQKCRNQYEERKCRILANVFANVGFEPSVTENDAVLVLELADRLTYRQLCMITLAGRHKDFGVGPFRDFTMKPGKADPSLRWEWQELYNRYWLITDTDDVPILTRLGALVFKLGNLGSIPSEDIHTVWQSLQQGLRHHRDAG
jgi:hypothetical protein